MAAAPKPLTGGGVLFRSFVLAAVGEHKAAKQHTGCSLTHLAAHSHMGIVCQGSISVARGKSTPEETAGEVSGRNVAVA